MKKWIALLLTMMVFLATVPSTALATFDLSYYTQRPETFQVETNSDLGLGIITTKGRPYDYRFTHKYNSEHYFSAISNAIVVNNCFQPSAFPSFITHIVYHADQPLNIHAVSFVWGGMTCTFTDDDSGVLNNIIQLDNGICEDIVIEYGSESSDFYSTILGYATFWFSMRDDNGQLREPADMKMILHGTEDVEVILPLNFWVDFTLLSYSLLLSSDLNFLELPIGTPCTITKP